MERASYLRPLLRAGVRHIVFSSSYAIHGQPEHLPIAEAARLDPINPYGFTKLACERMMVDFGRTYGLQSARLRYFNAAGADPAGEIGEDHDPEPHLIPLARPRADFLASQLAAAGSSEQGWQFFQFAACASMVLRLTIPAARSISVCAVAISCWPSVLRTMSRPLATGA